MKYPCCNNPNHHSHGFGPAELSIPAPSEAVERLKARISSWCDEDHRVTSKLLDDIYALINAQAAELKTTRNYVEWYDQLQRRVRTALGPHYDEISPEEGDADGGFMAERAAALIESLKAENVRLRDERERLLKLTKELQQAEHWQWLNLFENGESASADGHSGDVLTCSHPDCVLVRASGEAPMTPTPSTSR